MANRRTLTPREPISTGQGTGTVEERTDRQLLELVAVRRGHDGFAERAFAVLVQRHGAMVLGICRQLLGDEHAAEDAFQVTFLVLAGKAGSIQRPELLGHWLYGVAVRTARKAKRLRNQTRRREVTMLPLPAEPIDAGVPNEVRLIQREQVELLHEELGRLPEKYRVPIVLCDLEGMTHAEAARRLGWPVGTLSVRLVRARAALRARLVQRGLGPVAGLLVTTVVSERARAAVPSALAVDTVRLALRYTTGSGLTTGMAATSPSIKVAVLLEKVLFSMVPETMVAMTLMAVLVAGLVVTGAGALTPPIAENRTSAPPATLPGAMPTHEASDRVVARQEGAVETESDREARNATGRNASSSGVPPVASSAPPDLEQTYRGLAVRVGHDAAAHVRLALWCEAHGLSAERVKHLALAVLIDPGQEPARGLLGQVDFRGRWRRPEDISVLLGGDTQFSAALAEYEVRRKRMEENADAHWRLALWCEQRGLEAEATAHFTAVTRRDPAREAAWRRLGCKEHHGRWMRPERIDAETAELEAQERADRSWKPLLAKWKSALQDDSRRAWAEAKLSGVTDPRAVPAIWAVFARGGPGSQTVATRLLGQLDGPATSRALALLAILGDSAEIRRTASETLARRDPRDIVSLLIGLLVAPIKYDVHPVQGPGAPGVLFVEGEPFNVRRFYTVPPLPESTIRRLNDPTTPPDGSALLAARLGDAWAGVASISNGAMLVRNNVIAVRGNLARAARATFTAQQQLVNDISVIENQNRAIGEANQRIESPLRAITGQDLGHDRAAWQAWWTDHQGYAYEASRSAPKPTLDEEIPLPYNPGYRPITGMSCFGAGTLVHTRSGTRPIESLRLGDVVLTLETKTGALGFAPVLTVYHNKPAATLRINLGDASGECEPIVATGIHRFWKVGRGWVMARDLKSGDAVRTLAGSARVSTVSAERVEPVFNLEVGKTSSFFAGQAAALVHDNSMVEPVHRPFDAVDESMAQLADAGTD